MWLYVQKVFLPRHVIPMSYFIIIQIAGVLPNHFNLSFLNIISQYIERKPYLFSLHLASTYLLNTS